MSTLRVPRLALAVLDLATACTGTGDPGTLSSARGQTGADFISDDPALSGDGIHFAETDGSLHDSGAAPSQNPDYVLECPNCRARMRPLATITDAHVIHKILAHLQVRADPLPRARARDPTGQEHFDFDAA